MLSINFFKYNKNYYIKKMFEISRKSYIKKFILLYLLQLIIFGILVFTSFSLYHNNFIEQKKAEYLDSINLSSFEITREYPTILNDLIFLQGTEVLKNYIHFPSQKNKISLEKQMLYFSKSRRMYYQFRYININGLEEVKVTLEKGQLEPRLEEKLQDKSERYYFKNIINMDLGQFYMSNIDLNIENGHVEYPLRPTIRFGIPVFTDDGIITGALVLNYDLRDALTKFKNLFNIEGVDSYILKDDGGYLSSRYLDQIPTTNDLKDDLPNIWEHITKGKQDSNTDLLVYKDFYIIKDLINSLSIPYDNLMFVGPEGDVIDRKFTLIVLERDLMPFKFFSYQTVERLMLYVLLQIVIAVLIYYIMVLSINKKSFSLWMESFFQGIERNPLSIVLTDSKGYIEYTNNMFSELTGYKKEEVYKQHTRVLKSGKTNDDEYKQLWESISQGCLWSGEFYNKRKDGSLFWISASISPIYDNFGKIVKYLGIQEDITEKKLLNEKLTFLAQNDSLTTLLNRRAFFNKLENEILRHKRIEKSMIIIMSDIDKFKNVNDLYGHQIGDEVLIHISNILKRQVRNMDLLGRYGGEEFILALPETGLDESITLAERLRNEVENSFILSGNEEIKVTISIGIALWHNTEDISSTIRRADDKLYKAKENGRNCVVF